MNGVKTDDLAIKDLLFTAKYIIPLVEHTVNVVRYFNNLYVYVTIVTVN